MALRTRLSNLVDRPVLSIALLMAVCILVYGFLALRKPEIYVYPDCVTFQALAKDLAYHGHFQFGQPFRPRVPPLFPVYLSLGYLAGDRMLVHTVQTILVQIAFFSALIPLYFLSRRILSHRRSLLVLVLFCVLPIALYTRWLMSEALFIPWFTLSALAIVECTGRAPRPRHAWALAACFLATVLTRITGLLIFGLLAAALLERIVECFRKRDQRRAALHLLWHGLAPGLIFAVALFAAWKAFGYIQTRVSGAFYTRPMPMDYFSIGFVRDYSIALGRNLLIWLLGMGIFPMLLFFSTLVYRKSSDARYRSYLIMVWAAFLIHWSMLGYVSYHYLLKTGGIKTYARYAVVLVPLMLPIVVAQIPVVADRLKGKDWRTGLCVLVLIGIPWVLTRQRDLIERMLWVAGSNLQSAPLAWLIRQTQVSNLQVFAALSVLGILWMLALRWRPLLGYWTIVVWALALQVSGQDFLNWVHGYRVRTESIQSIQAFCLDYAKERETLPIVVEKSEKAIDFRTQNISFWTPTEPVVAEGGQKLPPDYYYAGQAREDLPIRWNEGSFIVYRVKEASGTPSFSELSE